MDNLTWLKFRFQISSCQICLFLGSTNNFENFLIKFNNGRWDEPWFVFLKILNPHFSTASFFHIAGAYKLGAYWPNCVQHESLSLFRIHTHIFGALKLLCYDTWDPISKKEKKEGFQKRSNGSCVCSLQLEKKTVVKKVLLA